MCLAQLSCIDPTFSHDKAACDRTNIWCEEMVKEIFYWKLPQVDNSLLFPIIPFALFWAKNVIYRIHYKHKKVNKKEYLLNAIKCVGSVLQESESIG